MKNDGFTGVRRRRLVGGGGGAMSRGGQVQTLLGPIRPILFGPKYQLGPSRFGSSHLGSPIRLIPFGPLGFVSLRRVLN